jgi:hypothetical protein
VHKNLDLSSILKYLGLFFFRLIGTPLRYVCEFLYERVLKILYFMKGQSIWSTLVYYASLSLLLAALTWHPLLRDDSDTFLQEIIPISVPITRLVNPLRMKMKANDYTEHDTQKKAFHYIRDDILSYSDKKAGDMETTYDPLTPLHKTMILMGCYGDMTAKNPENLNQNLLYPLIRFGRKESIPFDFSKISSESDFMQKSKRKSDNAFMTNLMLQALEDRNNYNGISRGVFGSIRDRSTCDCMRDFATPSLMEVSEDNGYCDSEKTSQNSCGVQNILDYTMNGDLKDATNGTKQQLIGMSPISNSRAEMRNRADPLRVQFDTWFGTQYPGNPSATGNLATNTPLFAFLKLYCDVQGYKNIVHPEGTQSEGESKKRYDEQESRKCLVSAQDYLTGKAGAVSLTLVQARDMVYALIQNMHAHNKLQTPKVSKSGALQASGMPTQISYKSVKHYLSKYQAVFETCDQIAVPNYVTRISAYSNSVNWLVLGNLTLLLAASVAFWWAYTIRYMELQEKVKDEDTPAWCGGENSFLSKIFYFVNMLFVVTTCVISFIYMVRTVNDKFSQSDVESEDHYLFTTFAALFWIFFLVMLAIVVAMIFYIVNVMYKGGIEMRAHDFLIKLIFGAQIAMDVPVILGLTFIAVGSCMQRGVGDFYLLSTIMIFFILIGFTTHVTNVLRILDLIAQSSGSQDTHASKIKYNRVAFGVIISLMLFLSLYLAGLDSYQGDSFGVWYYLIFIFVGILVLCVSDLTLEFLCLFKIQKFDTPREMVFSFIHQKAKNLAWIIIISVFVLNFYTYITICNRSEPVLDRADVCNIFLGST